MGGVQGEEGCRGYQGKRLNIPTERISGMKQSLFTAIATDSHFWLPVTILIFGVIVLIALR